MAPKVRVHPPVYLLLCLMAMAALHMWLPLFQYLDAPLSFIGVPLGVGGIAVAALSAARFNRAGTGLVPFTPATTLITGGFYRYSRNPMYLGMTVLLLGAALLLGSIAALLPVAVFAAVLQTRFIRCEEVFLEQTFGQPYLDYKARVGRWL